MGYAKVMDILYCLLIFENLRHAIKHPPTLQGPPIDFLMSDPGLL